MKNDFKKLIALLLAFNLAFIMMFCSFGNLWTAYADDDFADYDYEIKDGKAIEFTVRNDDEENGSVVFYYNDDCEYHEITLELLENSDSNAVVSGFIIHCGASNGTTYEVSESNTIGKWTTSYFKPYEFDPYADPNSNYFNFLLQSDVPDSYAKVRLLIEPAHIMDNCTIKQSKKEFAYTGKKITINPTVTFNGQKLKEGTDYYINYFDNKNVGVAQAAIIGKGRFDIEESGFKNDRTVYEENACVAWVDYNIVKAANPLSVKAKTAPVKYSKLKKNKQTLAVTKVIKFVKKGEGTMSYTLSSAKKGSKSYKKYFSINKKTGKVTVKKGLKKGTYNVTVKVKAAGNKNYKASAEKKVTFKIQVK